MTRTQYHTFIKDLARMGALPKDIEKLIPRANLHRWRNELEDKYFKCDVNQFAFDLSDDMATLVEFPKARKVLVKCIDVYKGIINSSKSLKQEFKNSKEQIVNTILSIKDIIPVKEAIQFFNISRTTFQSWLLEVKCNCSESFLHICNKNRPNQLTFKEVTKMKELLTSKQFLHWPIRSIQAFAFREGLLFASVSTWYRYTRILGLRLKPIIPSKKERTPKPVLSQFPNQKWHADVTVFKTADKIKHYIYLVVDNYSRMIISYSVSTVLSAENRLVSIKEAYQKALQVNPDLNVDLIVDGGSENNNILVDNFIQNSQININKLIALKQIEHSNSAVEAVNKTIKYRYLFITKPQNSCELESDLQKLVFDYNEVRPHGRLQFQTPFEAWTGMVTDLDMFRKLSEKAKQLRIQYNQNNTCNQCMALI